MQIGSDCGINCLWCQRLSDGCFAGHGDDDYVPASKSKLLATLKYKTAGGKIGNRELSEFELSQVRGMLKELYGESALECIKCDVCITRDETKLVKIFIKDADMYMRLKNIELEKNIEYIKQLCDFLGEVVIGERPYHKSKTKPKKHAIMIYIKLKDVVDVSKLKDEMSKCAMGNRIAMMNVFSEFVMEYIKKNNLVYLK